MARRVRHDRGRSDQVLGQRLAVDGMCDGLPDPLVGEEFLSGRARSVELEIGHAQRLGVLDHKGWIGLQPLGLVLGHIPEPVDGAGHQFGGARVAILDGAEHDLGDRRGALEAAFEVGGIPLHQDVLAGLDLRDLVRAGAVGRNGAEILLAVRPCGGVVVVPLLHDEPQSGEIGERRREWVVQMDAHVVPVDLLGALDPGEQREVRDRILFVGHEIERVDDIVGIHRRAGMERDVLAQLHVQRGRVHPAPLGREQRPDVGGLGVDDDERVPGMVADDDELARVEKERIGDRVVAVGRPDQRVVLLAGFCLRSGRDARCSEHADKEEAETKQGHDGLPGPNTGPYICAPTKLKFAEIEGTCCSVDAAAQSVWVLHLTKKEAPSPTRRSTPFSTPWSPPCASGTEADGPGRSLWSI